VSILLGFAPFIAFALLERVLGVVPALCAAAAISLAIVLRDALTTSRSVKLLELGSLILFGGLALFALATHAEWSVLGVRLRVDAGLLIIVLVSLAVRRPFTLAYAKEQAPREYWNSPVFLRLNDVLTSAWAAAFGVLVAADLLMIYVPSVPLTVGIVVTIAALAAAIWFSRWYPEKVRQKVRAAAPSQSAS
jgi:hypothetical protein